ncbi:Poly(ADP-ribose) glycohydrolase [Zootermopsis nevadensis]|uniref:Poly(ADP-ribose) glycohydrolase n=1 Tax=Zootermopsis nevadensis TaxID=136037 RepID=A0A067QTD2_ZOONE|nr:Poly(ADP-ribose) glycohydrolase [Zootermopsis nevadensis]
MIVRRTLISHRTAFRHETHQYAVKRVKVEGKKITITHEENEQPIRRVKRNETTTTRCERLSTYRGYSSTFEWMGNYQDMTPRDSSGRRMCSVVAIDALQLGNCNLQYTPSNLLRELNKAYAGFHCPEFQPGVRSTCRSLVYLSSQGPVRSGIEPQTWTGTGQPGNFKETVKVTPYMMATSEILSVTTQGTPSL